MKHVFCLFTVISIFLCQGYPFRYYNELLRTNIDDFGRVHYKHLSETVKKELQKEVTKASNHNPIDKPQHYKNKNDEFAYWINLYNIIVLNEVVQHYPIKSIQDIPNVWKKKHSIGQQNYSLDEIEHQILRKEFSHDPRFHFALICASYSCPKLKNSIYTGKDLELQFATISNEFYENQLTFNLYKKSKELYVSKIFDWYNDDYNISMLKRQSYTSDFEFKKAVVIDYLIKKAPSDISQFLVKHKNSIKFDFMTWHWKLNESIQ